MMLMLKPKMLQKYSRRTLLLLSVLGLVGIFAGGGAVYAKLGGSLSPSGNTDINLQKGLYGWWKLDGNALDATPNANNGSVTGATPTTDRKNQANRAYSFDNSSVIGLGDPTRFNMSTTSFSISAWFYATSYDEGGIFGKWTGTYGTSSYMLTTYPSSGDKLAFTVANGSNAWASDYAGSPQYPLNQWNHVVATFDNTTGQVVVYLNNSIYSTGTSGYTTTNSTTTQAVIGGWGGVGGAAALFNGKIDDVRLYKRVLNTSEVTALYNSYDPSIKAGSGENSLIGWWKFDGNTKDSTPYADNGTGTGVTPTADRKARASAAYSFNGTSNYVQVPYSATTHPTTAVSISAWIYTTDNASTAEQRIVSTTESGGYSLYLTGSSANQCAAQKICFLVISGSNYQWLQVNKTVLTNNAWNLLTATYDSATGKLVLFLNGTSIANNTLSALAITYSFNNPLCIGAEATSSACSGSYYNGAIDDVRVYSRALTPADALNLYKTYNAQINLNTNNANNGSGVAVNNIYSGLIGSWALNGNAKDGTPNSNNGTITSVTPAADRKNRASGAMAFDGSTSQINVPNTALLNPSSVTLSLWVKGSIANTGGVQKGIVNKMTSSGISNPPYGMYAQDGKIYWSCNDANNISIGIATTSFGALQDNVWYNVVGTYDASKNLLAIFLNGAQIATATNQCTGSLATTTGALQFGIHKNLTARMFTGTIDDVRLWNRALSPSDIAQLYTSYQ